MFLSFNYAIIADTDINSEWMRNLGSIRYTIRGIRNVVSVKHYDGELGFKGVQMINRNQKVEINHLKNSCASDSFKHLVIFNAPFIGQR